MRDIETRPKWYNEGFQRPVGATPLPIGTRPRPGSPSFDKDGYPTEETLLVIREWPYPFEGLLAYVKECWRYKDCVREMTIDDLPMDFLLPGVKGLAPKAGTVALITGGWSGNESIVGALESNLPFYGMSWIASYRGGKHLFQFPKEGP